MKQKMVPTILVGAAALGNFTIQAVVGTERLGNTVSIRS